MVHLLALPIPNAGNSLAQVFLWIQRSARGICVAVILGIFLIKMGASWKHFLEILILLILGVWFIPSLVPPKASAIIAQVNTGGSAGTTGVSWGMLALLVMLVAVVIYTFR
jgi:uncharacterized membrane protein